jgi:hypothetical protein
MVEYIYYLNPSGYVGFAGRFRVVPCCFPSDPLIFRGFPWESLRDQVKRCWKNAVSGWICRDPDSGITVPGAHVRTLDFQNKLKARWDSILLMDSYEEKKSSESFLV